MKEHSYQCHFVKKQLKRITLWSQKWSQMAVTYRKPPFYKHFWRTTDFESLLLRFRKNLIFLSKHKKPREIAVFCYSRKGDAKHSQHRTVQCTKSVLNFLKYKDTIFPLRLQRTSGFSSAFLCEVSPARPDLSGLIGRERTSRREKILARYFFKFF